MEDSEPITLYPEQPEETKKAAAFAKKVAVILHTCNPNEYWAVVERMEPPTDDDGTKIADKPISHVQPEVEAVIGWFAKYRAAAVRTEQGIECLEPLTDAFKDDYFPNAQVIIGAGIAYTCRDDISFADVLISDQIEDFSQTKEVKGEIRTQGERVKVKTKLLGVFKRRAVDWKEFKSFICAASPSDRSSSVHIGCIVSTPTLIRDKQRRDERIKHTPNVIGGEMEGWALLKLMNDLKHQQNKEIAVIIIKGVADYGTDTKGDQWQWTAAKAAVDCVHYCLQKTGGKMFNAGDL